MGVCFDPANGNTLGIEKTLLEIFQELNALSAADKTAVWAAFTSGSPPLWALDGEPGVTHGHHADALAACAGLAIDMSISAAFTLADQTKARLRMVAIYLLDNPRWLADSSMSAAVKAIIPYVPNPP